jgi:hypothetical protein
LKFQAERLGYPEVRNQPESGRLAPRSHEPWAFNIKIADVPVPVVKKPW